MILEKGIATTQNLRFPLKLNLQHFADGGEAATGEAGTGETGTEGSGEEGQGNAPKGFDDLLKDKTYQSEFDKRVAKALETAKGKWEATKQQELEDAKSEAAKLAKMNADDKAKYEAQKREDDYNNRLKELTTRELKAEAYEQLSEKNLPKELVEILNYESAETVKSSMEAVEKAFQGAVEKAVNEKLKGKGTPRSGQGNAPDAFNFGFTGVRPRK